MFNDFEFLERNLDRQLGWVRAAESRIALILPLATALFGSLAVKMKTLDLIVCWKVASVSAAILFIALSFIFAVVGIFPRVNGPKHSLIFFGGVGSASIESFHKKTREISEDGLKTDLREQIYINARIATLKYKWIKRSMTCLLISLVPWAISVGFLYW